MIIYIVLCFALFEAPSMAYTYQKPDATIEAAKNQLPLKNLLQGVGSKLQIGELLYNETSEVKLCFTNILYVNESKGFATPWHEYRVVFEFPEVEENHNVSSKKYRQYAIEISETEVRQYDFEVIDEHPDYVVSKHENITCGLGRLLAKAYYESPQTDRRRIVFKLSNEFSGFKYGEPEFQSVDFEKEADVLGSAILGQPDGGRESTSNADQTTAIENTNFVTTTPIPKRLFLQMPKTKRVYARKTPTDLTDEIVSDLREETTESTPSDSSEALPKVGSCSPFLAQFFSGNTILPGLCNLTENQSVVLQGDIVVSKKYFNAANQSDVLQPMFIIHENTEIQATLKEAPSEEVD